MEFVKDRYLTVSALTKYIKHKLEMDKNLKDIYLRGEISNFKHHSRGHMYFTLKDNGARIQAVMFQSQNRTLKFIPEDGMSVLVRAEIGLYEPHGQYQLYVHEMQPDGIGTLYIAFEQLKEKLEKEGLFSESRKKVIPKYPEHVGIITSPTGAAIRDIITTINRRYPIVKKTILPVLVQGPYAPQSIVDAIIKANQLGQFDVIILGRGGGSLEELWAFNEEIVARAIANSSIPIISAVGHETDFTISDFVADLRAPTPTGAAELAVPSISNLQEKIDLLSSRIQRAVNVQVNTLKERLCNAQKSYAFRYPLQLLRQKELDLDRLHESFVKVSKQYIEKKKDKKNQLINRIIPYHPARNMEKIKLQLQHSTDRMYRAMKNKIDQKKSLFMHRLESLSLLSPLEVIKRGYSITYNDKQKVIKSIKQVKVGENLRIKIADGSIRCNVIDKDEEEN
jgi:exodeoxyribonuclease VII large subunit